MEISILQTVFQAVTSKFVAERDDAVSKMNRAIASNDPDLEGAIKEYMAVLAIANNNIETTQKQFQAIYNAYMANLHPKTESEQEDQNQSE